MKNVIFDFNGTMFLDKDFHKAAWLRYSAELGHPATEEIFYQHMWGPTNDDIFTWMFGRKLPRDESDRLGEGKERIYRELCEAFPGGVRLADGLPEALDAMKAMGVRMNIATASAASNVEYYIPKFRLDHWFDCSKIVFDDGTVPQKPDPALYRLAAERLGLQPKECVIVEDSMTGYQAAAAAGAGEIVMMDTTMGPEAAAALAGVTRVIHDFWGFERYL